MSSDLNGTIFCTISCWIRAAEKQSCHWPACTLVHRHDSAPVFTLLSGISSRTSFYHLCTCSLLELKGSLQPGSDAATSACIPTQWAQRIYPFNHENKPATGRLIGEKNLSISCHDYCISLDFFFWSLFFDRRSSPLVPENLKMRQQEKLCYRRTMRPFFILTHRHAHTHGGAAHHVSLTGCPKRSQV